MAAADLLNAHRVTGLLLILTFLLFAIGGTLPVVGQKGNARIFTLPVREHLLAVAANAWRWGFTGLLCSRPGWYLAGRDEPRSFSASRPCFTCSSRETRYPRSITSCPC